MAKPICLVTVNMDMLGTESQSAEEKLSKVQTILSKMFNDYHVLVISSQWANSPMADIQVFYENDFTEIKYNELKELILNKLHVSNTIPQTVT